jgi:dTDP-glucose 4,6-dehydratase
MYAADLTNWLWSILVGGDSCRAYNVGSDKAISIRDVADVIARLSGCKVETGGRARSAGDAPTCYVPCIERARTELGLNIETDFETAILRTFNWYRDCNFAITNGAVTCA